MVEMYALAQQNQKGLMGRGIGTLDGGGDGENGLRHGIGVFIAGESV